MWEARKLALVAAIAGVALGLGCSSDSTSGSKIRSFADYWASGEETFCARDAACGFVDEATCLAGWDTVEDVTAALADAGIPEETLADCEAAARLFDKCALGLTTCEQFSDLTLCSVQRTALDAECSLVRSAMSLYYMTHPRSVHDGSFSGSYEGAASGTFTGQVSTDGKVTASIQTSTGPVNATGSTLFSGQVMLSASVDNVPMNFEGKLSGKTHAFTGTGTWTAGPDNGTWTLTSN
jgi:hypothetical protein